MLNSVLAVSRVTGKAYEEMLCNVYFERNITHLGQNMKKHFFVVILIMLGDQLPSYYFPQDFRKLKSK